MIDSGPQSDNQPLAWFRGRPVYMAAVLVVVQGLGIIASCGAFGSAVAQAIKPFDPRLTFNAGEYWHLLTYLFYERDAIMALLGMFLFYVAASEFEKFYGRRRLGFLLLMLLIVPPLVSTSAWFMGVERSSVRVAGLGYIGLGCYFAFATIYRNIEVLGSIRPFTIAVFLLALNALFYMFESYWIGVFSLGLSCAMGMFYAHRLKTEGEFGAGVLIQSLFKPRPKIRVLPDPPRRSKPRPAPAIEMETSDETEVDALLDKIAKNGLSSLTDKERAKLERAREELLKKDSAK